VNPMRLAVTHSIDDRATLAVCVVAAAWLSLFLVAASREARAWLDRRTKDKAR
jgi:hypothetical protein